MNVDYTFDLLGPEVVSHGPSVDSGGTRGNFLRRLVTGGGALLAGGAVVAEFAPAAEAASAEMDVTILNAALIIENLGKTFYAEAMKNVKLTGDTKTFVSVVHSHEVAHAKFVKEALGKDAKKVPGFTFGSHTQSQAAVEAFAYSLEGICTAALVGVGPLLTRKTLAKAGPLLPVEAQHVAWISNIRDKSPAPSPFNVKDTLGGVEKLIAPYLKKS